MTRPNRRRFLRGGLGLAGLGLLAGCGVVPSQPLPRSAKIGVLSTLALDPSPEGTAFREALRDLGYAQGRNLALAFRSAGQPETLASAAAELIGQGVDVMVAVDDEATRAARDASDTVPIVMADSRDPLGAGLIASLGRPGGNVTGLASLTVALGPKRLELLRAAAPGVSRVAFLWWARTGGLPDMRDLQTAAQAMGVQVIPVIERSATDAALSLVGLHDPVDGIIMLSLASARSGAARIAASLDAMHLPAIYDAGSFAHAGGLMAYGADTPGLFRRAATYVDKILKGAKPADLPVEQPTTFDLVINLKTAQTLGLTIPVSVLQQATEVIQ
jgi:putative ABC transport system substrate-binding protein